MLRTAGWTPFSKTVGLIALDANQDGVAPTWPSENPFLHDGVVSATEFCPHGDSLRQWIRPVDRSLCCKH